MESISATAMECEAQSICVVDDDDAVRDSLRMLLESYGKTVEDFASARAFLARGRERHYGCLLLDLHMPEMSGLDLLDAMHEDGPWPPAILISGRIDPASARHAREAGAYAVLDKPVDDATLLRSIEGAMAASRH
jgi:two-component system response regulator FixJ